MEGDNLNGTDLWEGRGIWRDEEKRKGKNYRLRPFKWKILMKKKEEMEEWIKEGKRERKKTT